MGDNTNKKMQPRDPTLIRIRTETDEDGEKRFMADFRDIIKKESGDLRSELKNDLRTECKNMEISVRNEMMTVRNELEHLKNGRGGETTGTNDMEDMQLTDIEMVKSEERRVSKKSWMEKRT